MRIAQARKAQTQGWTAQRSWGRKTSYGEAVAVRLSVRGQAMASAIY